MTFRQAVRWAMQRATDLQISLSVIPITVQGVVLYTVEHERPDAICNLHPRRNHET